MGLIIDFPVTKNTDATVNVQLTPATPIGGWSIQFQTMQHFGGVSGILTKSCASGFYGSGITLLNSGTGAFQVTINAVETSGLAFGPYSYIAQRTDSGSRTVLAEGFLNLTP